MVKKKSVPKSKKVAAKPRTKTSKKTVSKAKSSTVKKAVKRTSTVNKKKAVKKTSTVSKKKAKTVKPSSVSTSSKNSSNGIGQLNETELHAALKRYCASTEASFEVKLDGYFIDVVEKDLLIEIQTRNFSAIKPKLKKLLTKHKVRLVHPIAQEKYLVKHDDSTISKRKSPKRGRLEHIFDELIRIPELVKHKNFELQVLLITSEEHRLVTPKVKWRDKGWKPIGKKLVEVHESHTFKTKKDFLKLLPKDLPSTFTTADLSKAVGINKKLASKIAFCLRKMELATVCGKQGRFTSYKLK